MLTARAADSSTELHAGAADFAVLVLRHQKGVWRFLRALGADPEFAEELACDAFVFAWQKGIGARAGRDAAAWFVSTARFLWLRRVRARRRAESAIAVAVEALWQRCCL